MIKNKSQTKGRMAMASRFQKKKYAWAILAVSLSLTFGVPKPASAQSGKFTSFRESPPVEGTESAVMSPSPSDDSTNAWGQVLYTHYRESDVCDAPMSSVVLWTLGANEAVKVDFKRGDWCAVFKPSERVRDIANAVGYMQTSDLFSTPLPPGPIEGGIGSAPPLALSIEGVPTLARIRESSARGSVSLPSSPPDAAEMARRGEDKRLKIHGISSIQWVELDEIYGTGSKLTDLEKAELWRRYEGRRVQWTGELLQIDEDDSLCIRMNQATETIDVRLKLVLTKAALERARQLKNGDVITFRGTFLSSEIGIPIRLGFGEIVK